MGFGQTIEDLAVGIGIDVDSQGFKDFQDKMEKTMDSVVDATKRAMPHIANATKKAMPVIGKAMGSAVVGLGKATAVGIGAVGTAVAGVGVHMVSFGDEYNKAMAQLKSSTGATEEEMKSLGETAKRVYGSNFGENLDDVVNSIAVVKKAIGATGEELENATKSGIALRDTFGFEMEESTRAVSSLMKQFGVDAEKAYEIIATGAQKGANQNDDLLDTLNEYSNHYSQLGLSADDFLNSLITATEQGVFSIDKVGDAVKEFGIRAQDGSKASMEAFETLGFKGEEMTKRFASGGESAKNATFEVVSALEKMEDPVKKNAAAVALFGTMYEDLGPKILPILSSMKTGTLDTKGALDEINKVKFNDLGSAIEGVKRALEVSLLPVASAVASEITSVANEMSSLLSDGFQAEDIDKISELIQEKIGQLAQGIKEYGPELITTISEVLQSVVSNLATIIPTLLPVLAEGAMELVSGLLKTIVDNTEPLAKTVVDVVTMLAQFIVENLPLVVDAAVKIVIALANGLAGSVEQLIPSVILATTTIVDGLINNLEPLLSAALVLINALAKGLVQAIPVLMGELPKILNSIVKFLIDGLPKILGVGGEIVGALATGIVGAIPSVVSGVASLVAAIVVIVEKLPKALIDIGVEMVAGLWKGILSMKDWLTSKVKGFFSGITKGVKEVLDIHSPSRVYAEIGSFMGQGVGVGFDESMDLVSKEMQARIPTDFDIATNISTVSKQKVVTTYTGAVEQEVKKLKSDKEQGLIKGSNAVNLHVYIDKNFGSDFSEVAKGVKKAFEQEDLRIGGKKFCIN